jgi:hypothetical protein
MNYGLIKLVLLLFCAFPVSLCAQSNLKNFTSPDGVFQFKYSSKLIECTTTKDNGENSVSQKASSCTAYYPFCDNYYASLRIVTVVCLALPLDEMQEYFTFEGAAFSVSEVGEADSEKLCLIPPPNAFNSPKDTKRAAVNNAQFTIFRVASGGMSQWVGGDVYRTFHRGKCFELSVLRVLVDPGALDDPGKPLTDGAWNRVDAPLTQALNSFQFLK